MKINRTDEGELIYFNSAGKEIHPYLGILAAIENQMKKKAPNDRRLTHEGWVVVCNALETAILHTKGPTVDHAEPVQIFSDDGVTIETFEISQVEEVSSPEVKKGPTWDDPTEEPVPKLRSLDQFKKDEDTLRMPPLNDPPVAAVPPKPVKKSMSVAEKKAARRALEESGAIVYAEDND